MVNPVSLKLCTVVDYVKEIMKISLVLIFAHVQVR